MTINSLHFLTTISRNIYYRTVHYLRVNSLKECQNALEDVMRVYKQGGFNIVEILLDNGFRKLVREFGNKYSNINLNFANPNDHVPEAERNNRVIQERVRATYHRLPFVHLPRNMVKYLTLESTKKLNFVPAKYGVSKYYSPRMIVNKQNLNYSKHCNMHSGPMY